MTQMSHLDSRPKNPAAAASGPSRVVIAGGGVAALEALIALRQLAHDRVSISLVAPEPEFIYDPLRVAQAFGMSHVRRYELAEIADMFGAELLCDRVTEVDPDACRVRCTSREELDFDHLVLAVGADARPAYARAITFGDDPTEEALCGLLADIEGGFVDQVAFVVPDSETVWPLPIYEIALMTARQAWSMGMDRLQLTLVTPEERPLGVFGTAASEAVGALLKGHAIDFIGSTYASVGSCDVVLDPGGRRLNGARAVSLPVLDGPRLAGVPADRAGFIPTDEHGRVPGLGRVYAAGDATTFPIKQGGLATQQADAVAESIAAEVGAPVEPAPFRPVLRGLLLTGGDGRYMCRVLDGSDDEGSVATHPLWSPPAKIASRYLAPYLFAATTPSGSSPPTLATSSSASSSGAPSEA